MTPPFKPSHIHFLKALREVLHEIDNPEGYTHPYSYRWTTRQTQRYGSIPTLEFSPRGASGKYKEEILERAGLLDHRTDIHHQSLDQLRQKHSAGRIATKRERAARHFNRILDQIMHKTKSSLATAGYLNHVLTTNPLSHPNTPQSDKGPQEPQNPLSSPISMIMDAVTREQKFGAPAASMEPVSSPEPSSTDQNNRESRIFPNDQESRKKRTYEEELHEA